MTNNEIYTLLQNGGAYALPYLIEIRHPTAGVYYFVNNNEDIVFNDHIYKASTFNYTRPKTQGGVLTNGSLEITAIENNLIELLDDSDELLTIKAVGVLADAQEVTPLKTFKHQYGAVTIDESMKISFTFTNDDRLEMTFPPYVFDYDNNRGNA